MEFDPIFTSNAAVVPAKVFDKLWVQEITISAPSPTNDAAARVKFKKFASTEAGPELSSEPPIFLDINTLFSRAETDAELAAIIKQLMAYVRKVALQRGIAAPAGVAPVLPPGPVSLNDLPESL